MTATNHDKSPRLQLSGRDIAGACLAACGLLLIIWGGTLESVTVTDPGFMSFAVGACLAPAVPRTARVALIWLATLTSMLYLFIIDMAVIVSLMSCVVIAGIAAWLTVRTLRCDKTAGSTR